MVPPPIAMLTMEYIGTKIICVTTMTKVKKNANHASFLKKPFNGFFTLIATSEMIIAATSTTPMIISCGIMVLRTAITSAMLIPNMLSPPF